jgi:hypothetical protein
MKNSKFLRLFFSLAVLLILPLGVDATGIIGADPTKKSELSQLQAIVHFENGKENLFLKSSYRTQDGKIAMIVPVPAKASFGWADPVVFDIEEIVSLEQSPGFSVGAESIMVLRQPKADSISYIVGKDLYQSLAKNGFSLRSDLKKYLDHYISLDWGFVVASYDFEAVVDSGVKKMQETDPVVDKVNFADKLAASYIRLLAAADYDGCRRLLFEYSGLVKLVNSGLLPEKFDFASNDEFFALVDTAALQQNSWLYEGQLSADIKSAIFILYPSLKKEILLADLKKLDPLTEYQNMASNFLKLYKGVMTDSDFDGYRKISLISDVLRYKEFDSRSVVYKLQESDYNAARLIFNNYIQVNMDQFENDIKADFSNLDKLDDYNRVGTLQNLRVSFSSDKPVFPLQVVSISAPVRLDGSIHGTYVKTVIVSPDEYYIMGMDSIDGVIADFAQLKDLVFAENMNGDRLLLSSAKKYRISSFAVDFYSGELKKEAQIVVYDKFVIEELPQIANFLYFRNKDYFINKLGLEGKYDADFVNFKKYLSMFVEENAIKVSAINQLSIDMFLNFGTDNNVLGLGAGERAAVIKSYYEAYGRFPASQEDFTDLVLIANGRWPNKKSAAAEKKAQQQFIKIYKRIPDMTDKRDEAAITVMAYGLRQKASNRNLGSEAKGISTFRSIYGHNPVTTEEWNIMQAITYSGSARSADADGDLLPDSREAKYGTDPKKKDSDGDGYTDGEEVLNGYNPKGAGKL